VPWGTAILRACSSACPVRHWPKPARSCDPRARRSPAPTAEVRRGIEAGKRPGPGGDRLLAPSQVRIFSSWSMKSKSSSDAVHRGGGRRGRTTHRHGQRAVPVAPRARRHGGRADTAGRSC
jgi:hypothetical protein